MFCRKKKYSFFSGLANIVMFYEEKIMMFFLEIILKIRVFSQKNSFEKCAFQALLSNKKKILIAIYEVFFIRWYSQNQVKFTISRRLFERCILPETSYEDWTDICYNSDIHTHCPRSVATAIECGMSSNPTSTRGAICKYR